MSRLRLLLIPQDTGPGQARGNTHKMQSAEAARTGSLCQGAQWCLRETQTPLIGYRPCPLSFGQDLFQKPR